MSLLWQEGGLVWDGKLVHSSKGSFNQCCVFDFCILGCEKLPADVQADVQVRSEDGITVCGLAAAPTRVINPSRLGILLGVDSGQLIRHR